MGDVIAVFRSRNETVLFSSLLSSYGVSNQIVNTPRKANVSCGISSKFSYSGLEKAKEILSRRNFFSFAGFFRFIVLPSREIIVSRIN